MLLQVDSTTPAPGGVFTLPAPFTYHVHFNEPVDPASVQTSDLVLSGLADAAVSGVSVSGDGKTATFTIDGDARRGNARREHRRRRDHRCYGNPGAAFSASYVVDYGTAAYPVPLTSTAPLGSWIYDPVQTGVIAPAGDTDSFTISVDPGQTITVLAEADASLRPTIQLSVSGSVVATATAPAAGVDAVIQTYKVPGQIAATRPAPKTYTVTVSGAAGSTGFYTLKIILNAALETESHGGASNDTRPAAQSLENSFIALTVPAGSSTAAGAGGRAGSARLQHVATVFSADFETGEQGFTIDNDPANAPPNSLTYIPGFWHLSTGRGEQPGHSATTSFYYGQGEGPDGGGSSSQGTVNPSYGAISLAPHCTPGNIEYLLARLQLRPPDAGLPRRCATSPPGDQPRRRLAAALRHHDRVAESTQLADAADPVDVTAYATRQSFQFAAGFD